MRPCMGSMKGSARRLKSPCPGIRSCDRMRSGRPRIAGSARSAEGWSTKLMDAIPWFVGRTLMVATLKRGVVTSSIGIRPNLIEQSQSHEHCLPWTPHRCDFRVQACATHFAVAACAMKTSLDHDFSASIAVTSIYVQVVTGIMVRCATRQTMCFKSCSRPSTISQHISPQARV